MREKNTKVLWRKTRHFFSLTSHLSHYEKGFQQVDFAKGTCISHSRREVLFESHVLPVFCPEKTWNSVRVCGVFSAMLRWKQLDWSTINSFRVLIALHFVFIFDHLVVFISTKIIVILKIISYQAYYIYSHCHCLMYF